MVETWLRRIHGADGAWQRAEATVSEMKFEVVIDSMLSSAWLA